MPAVSDVVVLIGALAVFVERVTEVIVSAIWPDKDKNKTLRQLVGIALTAGLGIAIVVGLDLRLMKATIPESGLNHTQDLILTALLVGGGSAPAHEVLRYIEEKKKKAEAEKEEKQADAELLKMEVARVRALPQQPR